MGIFGQQGCTVPSPILAQQVCVLICSVLGNQHIGLQEPLWSARRPRDAYTLMVRKLIHVHVTLGKQNYQCCTYSGRKNSIRLHLSRHLFIPFTFYIVRLLSGLKCRLLPLSVSRLRLQLHSFFLLPFRVSTGR